MMQTVHHRKKMALSTEAYVFLPLILIGMSYVTLIQGSASVNYEQTENILMPSNISISFSRSCSSQLKAVAVCVQSTTAACKSVLYDISTLQCDFFDHSLKHDIQQAETPTTLIYMEIETEAMQAPSHNDSMNNNLLEPLLYSDCLAYYMNGERESGNYTLNTTHGSHKVWCDFDKYDRSTAIPGAAHNNTITVQETLPTTTTAAPQVYQDCQAYHNEGYRVDGVYSVSITDSLIISVWCQFGGQYGWTVIQRRIDGRQDFNLLWADYKQGFGDLSNEFWLGNDNIHYLTQTNKKLRIDITDQYGSSSRLFYYPFELSSEADGYRLNIAGYSGSAGDSLTLHDGQKFSTKDVENDNNPVSHCAYVHTGGWWFDNCFFSNLNGVWRGTPGDVGMGWYYWTYASHPRFEGSEMAVTRNP